MKTSDHNGAQKRTSSALSPAKMDQDAKKLQVENSNRKEKEDPKKNGMPSAEAAPSSTKSTDSSEMKQLLEPLMQEFKSLREYIDNKHHRLENKYDRLEGVVNNQSTEVLAELNKIKELIIQQKNELEIEVMQKVSANTRNTQIIIEEKSL